MLEQGTHTFAGISPRNVGRGEVATLALPSGSLEVYVTQRDGDSFKAITIPGGQQQQRVAISLETGTLTVEGGIRS